MEVVGLQSEEAELQSDEAGLLSEEVGVKSEETGLQSETVGLWGCEAWVKGVEQQHGAALDGTMRVEPECMEAILAMLAQM